MWLRYVVNVHKFGKKIENWVSEYISKLFRYLNDLHIKFLPIYDWVAIAGSKSRLIEVMRLKMTSKMF